MIAFLYRFLALHEPELRAQLDAFKVAQVDGEKPITAPRVIYAGTEDFPTREEAQERLAAAEIMAEIRWMEQEREKERAASPKVRRMPIREVK